MIGGSFQHDVCSTALNTNKYVIWDKHEHKSNISFHIDNGILNIPVNSSKINFGWLCESSAILPHVMTSLLENTNFFKNRFLNIFTYDNRLLNRDPVFFKKAQPPASSWIQNKKIYKKNKVLSFIGSNKTMCSGHLFRQQMILKFKDIADHFGRGFGNRELPWLVDFNTIKESGKILALKDYMFSIAMENSVYDDYYCEKITDCFATGTIPIYWGTRNINKYFDVDGVIFLEDIDDFNQLNEDLYLSKMKHIEKNLDIVKNMETAEDFIYLNYLKDL